MSTSAISMLHSAQLRLERAATLVSWRTVLLIALLLAIGLGIRLYNIDSAPLDFHATRQYRSLIIARDIYFQSGAQVADWQREVAAISRAEQGVFEPPLMETVAAAGYRLLGGEQPWLPRLLSSLMWLIGGLFLYSIISRIAGRISAIFGLAFYLFLPFAVVASRSFQPDPAMVMLMLASAWAALRHDAAPSRARLAVAAGLAAAAMLIHPRSAAVVLAVFAGLALVRHGARSARFYRDVLTFGAMALPLPLLVYGFVIASGSFQSVDAQANMQPQLWFSPFMWRGWLMQISVTVGFVGLVGALVGIWLLAEGRPRALALSLWAGYAAIGLIYNYAFATHDYNHLQLVPIVAICSAPIMALVAASIVDRRSAAMSMAAFTAVLALAVVLALVDARSRLANPGWQSAVAAKEEIGVLIDHSPNVIFLSADYGVALEYHGLLAGRPWPLVSDLEWETLVGIPRLAAADRFRQSAAYRGADYFVIEDLSEYQQQQDLREFLADEYQLVHDDDRYLIFDLRAGHVSTNR